MSTSTFGDVTVTCGFSSRFGSGDQFEHDTILTFQLANSSPSVFVTSATLQFVAGAAPTDFGFVECGDPMDSNSMFNENPAAPCTAQSTFSNVNFNLPTDSSGNPAVGSDGRLLVSFTNFSGLYSGTDPDCGPTHSGRCQGVTLFFEDSNENASFVSVAAVSTSSPAAPEPSAVALLIVGMVGLFAFTNLRKRSLRE